MDDEATTPWSGDNRVFEKGASLAKFADYSGYSTRRYTTPDNFVSMRVGSLI
jgi:hypothetical protein